VGSRRLRQIAGVALLGRDGDDLAAELEHGPGPGWRDGGAADPLRALSEPLAQLRQVGGDADPKPRVAPLRDVIEMERAGLLEDDPAGPGRGVEDREILEGRQPRDVLRRRIERIEVELAVAVGAEIDLAADPHRAGIVRPPLGLGDLVDAARADIEDPDPREGPAPVVLPLGEGLAEGTIGDRPAVRRHLGFVHIGDLEHGRFAAFHGHGEEPGVGPCKGEPGRGEQDGLAVRGEALDQVDVRMPGQPLGDASRRGDHVNVRVPVILAGEGDPFPVRGKRGVGLQADARGQPPDVPPVKPGRPQVVGVDEGDPVGRDGRLGQQLGVRRIDGRKPPKAGHHEKHERRRAHDLFHESLLQSTILNNRNKRRSIAKNDHSRDDQAVWTDAHSMGNTLRAPFWFIHLDPSFSSRASEGHVPTVHVPSPGFRPRRANSINRSF
jgi:hypothetical protein